jgi:hypothetical protein
MKTKLLLLSCFSVLILNSHQSVNGQGIVIEGGPDTVRISDRDGKPEPLIPGPSIVPAASPRSLAAGEAKRIGELKRELGIFDTGTSAALSLNMENVFSDGAATVDAIAENKLSLIAEYMQLTLAREIRLTYHFAPNLHDKDLAWARSVAMIKWMTENGGMAESTFTIQNPEVVKEAAPTSVPENGNLTAMQNRIEFNILFR